MSCRVREQASRRRNTARSRPPLSGVTERRMLSSELRTEPGQASMPWPGRDCTTRIAASPRRPSTGPRAESAQVAPDSLPCCAVTTVRCGHDGPAGTAAFSPGGVQPEEQRIVDGGSNPSVHIEASHRASRCRTVRDDHRGWPASTTSHPLPPAYKLPHGGSLDHWPGVNGLSALLAGQPLCATRPLHFFRPDGSMPDAFELPLSIPPHRARTRRRSPFRAARLRACRRARARGRASAHRASRAGSARCARAVVAGSPGERRAPAEPAAPRRVAKQVGANRGTTAQSHIHHGVRQRPRAMARRHSCRVPTRYLLAATVRVSASDRDMISHGPLKTTQTIAQRDVPTPPGASERLVAPSRLMGAPSVAAWLPWRETFPGDHHVANWDDLSTRTPGHRRPVRVFP